MNEVPLYAEVGRIEAREGARRRRISIVAHIRLSRPDFDLGFQVKVLEPL